MKQKAILLITDGIGCNASSEFNAFAAAKKPNYDWLFKNSANSLLQTSGLAVGLPDGQMGNSEVGHMTIGSGRVLYQNLVKIDKAIANGSLFESEILKNICRKCRRIHIIGLYSDGGVHSHFSHFDAICDFVREQKNELFVHAITDGRDVSPTSGVQFIQNLEAKFEISTISGRFYAMDRDRRWDRLQSYYDVIKEAKTHCDFTPSKYVQNSYDVGITDEFIEPICFDKFDGIRKDDGIIFINFRNDRARQLVAALGSDEFEGFARDEICKNIITMTNYDDSFDFEILFKNDEIKETLSEVIASASLSQLHTAETEKYAHVTFFLNGGKEEPVPNETRVLIPSPKVKTYDEVPQMSAFEVCDVVRDGILRGEDFIVVNFANGDMVGHTGNYEASIKAVEAVDECIGKILEIAKEHNYAYVQISDHGNCEAMRSSNGKPLTNHTTFDVFCFVLADGVKEIKYGKLSNVAPTILKIMGLEIPKVMDEPLF